METITRLTAIPENSSIANGFNKIDYCDVYRIVKETDDTAEEIATKIFKLSKLVTWLMDIRDAIAGLFGLKTSKEKPKGQTTIFSIIEQRKDEIVMGENDKHLDFRVSVLVDRNNSFIYLTTIVHFNNFLGRLYFILIKPFHIIIVKSSLKRQKFKKILVYLFFVLSQNIYALEITNKGIEALILYDIRISINEITPKEIVQYSEEGSNFI